MLRIFNAAGELVGEIIDDTDSPGGLIATIAVVGIILYIIAGTIFITITKYWYLFIALMAGALVLTVGVSLLIYRVLGYFRINVAIYDCSIAIGYIAFLS